MNAFKQSLRFREIKFGAYYKSRENNQTCPRLRLQIKRKQPWTCPRLRLLYSVDNKTDFTKEMVCQVMKTKTW